jgi:hypothetical protein
LVSTGFVRVGVEYYIVVPDDPEMIARAGESVHADLETMAINSGGIDVGVLTNDVEATWDDVPVWLREEGETVTCADCGEPCLEKFVHKVAGPKAGSVMMVGDECCWGTPKGLPFPELQVKRVSTWQCYECSEHKRMPCPHQFKAGEKVLVTAELSSAREGEQVIVLEDTTSSGSVHTTWAGGTWNASFLFRRPT